MAAPGAQPYDPRAYALRALVAAPASRQPAHSRHCPAHGPVRLGRADAIFDAMEREAAAEDDALGPPTARQLSLAAQLAEAREELAEARERRRRLVGRLRDHERRVLEQKRAAEAEKRRVSSFLRVG